MNRKAYWHKAFVGALLIWSFAVGILPVRAQDLVAVSDITGGSSIFVFRASRKAPPRNFVSTTKAKRVKAQRVETARKVTRQFTTIAKVAPRRTRSKSVDPFNLPPSPNSMPKEEAARNLAGVGEYYMDKEDTDKALYYFREANMLDAKNKSAQFGLSEALALKGNQYLAGEKPETAKKFFDEALSFNPKNAVAYYGIGGVFDDLEKEDEALVNYEKALAMDKDLTEIYVPLGIIYYRKGEIAKADEFLSKALKISPDNPETQYFLGLVRYSQNRNEEALTALKRAAANESNSAEAHYYAGKALKRLERDDEALTEFKEAVRLKPQYFEAVFDLGSINYELGNFPESVKYFKEATRLKNDNFEAYANLGDAYRQAGSFNDAESAYNLAVTFMERMKDYNRDDLAQIYSYAGYVVGRQCEINLKTNVPCRWSATIKNLEKAVELSPNASDYTNLGWAYYNAGKTDLTRGREAEGKPKLEQAKIALQKAIAMNPSFVEAPQLNLGVALIDLGEYSAAVDALRAVKKKRSDWSFVSYALGVAYFKNNDFKNAASEFRQAVDKDPKYIAALSGLGEAEFKGGNQKETEKVIGKLKSLNAVSEARKLETLIKLANFGKKY